MSTWTEADGRLLPGARYYAGTLGWKVFPTAGIVGGRCDCGENHAEPKDVGKHPRRGTHGFKDATTDTGQIGSWWAAAPDSNVGVPCADNGLVVVDVDPRSGGIDSFDVLESRVGGLPATVEAMTGEYSLKGQGGRTARGRHLFFKVGSGESFKANLNRDGLRGIDVKHNGYVLVSPSRHGSGHIYEWAPGKAPWEISIAEAPEELLAEIRSRKPRSAGAATYGVLEFGGEKIDVDALLDEGIPEGEREVTMYKLACAFANQYPVSAEHGKASVRQVMRVINATRVIPPLDYDKDLAHQVDRAIQFVLDNPKSRGLERALGLSVSEMETIAGGLAGGSEESGEVAGGGGAATAATAAVALTTKAAAGIGPGTGLAPGASLDVITGSRLKDPDAITETAGGRIGERTLTDIGNGRRIIDKAGAGVRYTANVGWFVWNGEYWVPDSDRGLIYEITKRLPTWIADEASNFEEGDARRDDLVKWAWRAKSVAGRKNAMLDAQTDTRIRVPVSQWDSNAELLGVKNGVINLRTGDLLPGDPGLYITKQSRVAYTRGLTNVRWTQFLEFATGGDKELQRYLQMAAGYTLTGLRDHEVLFLVYGPAGSGKSTLLEVLGTLLGDYYIPMDSDVLVEQPGAKSSTEYHMAQLMGKRMIGISEWPDARQTKEEAVKRLTGDLTISARHPSERPFQFESQAKLWIGTNAKPRISDAAMWRRIRAINFNHVPEKPDPSLKPYLLDPAGALPAALSWAVEGATMLLGSTDREPLAARASRHVLDATDEYRRSEDRMGLFLDEETKEVAGGSIAMKELFVHYRSWCEDRGEKPQTMIAFGRRLEEKGLRIAGSGSRAVLEGRVMMPRLVKSPGESSWGALVDTARMGS